MGKKLGFIILLTLVSAYYVAPTIIYFTVPKDQRGDQETVRAAIPNWLPKHHIKLGLDLQGGIQLVLGVNTDDAVDNRLGRIGTEAKRWSDDEGKKIDSAFNLKGKQLLRIKLAADADPGTFKNEFKDEFPGLEQAARDGNQIDFAYDETQMKRIKQGAVEQAERVIRSRVDKWGVSEPIINRRADGSVLVQLPGFNDPDKAKNLLGRTAQLKFKIVDDEFKGFDGLAGSLPKDVTVNTGSGHAQFTGENKDVLVNFLKAKVPDDRELLFEEEQIAGGRKLRYTSYIVKASTEISGEDVLDSGVTYDTQSLDRKPAVSLRFTGPGGKRFEEVTGANVQKRMAIVLDDTVVSAPVINQRIGGGNAIINLGRGGYNEILEEANELSLILKSGALPASIEVLEERQVGASLGPELAQQGIYAIILGLILVLTFMLIYYRRPGTVAALALVLNGLFLMVLMAGFGFALTLPGIAGFILTLGMAVDANVLINERIRQELRGGKNAKRAITSGFEKVFWTIIDANVTTLIAALVLLETNSSGPIRGFAITLIIGLSVSMFTSLFCTRTFFEFILRNVSSDNDIRSWFGGERINKKIQLDLDFLKFGKIAAAIGIMVALAVVGVGATKGMNWAVDFAGGTEMEVLFANDIDPKVIRGQAKDAGLKSFTLQALENSKKKYLLRFDKGDMSKEASTNSLNFASRIRSQLKDYGPSIQRVDFVGPQIGP